MLAYDNCSCCIAVFHAKNNGVFEVEESGGITGGLYWTFERCGEV
jgi:hypothetical protein